MNGENNHIFHTSAMDGVIEQSPSRGFNAAVMAGQLWLFAAFIALSLTAIGINTFLTGGEPLALYAVLALAGLVLFPIMLQNVARAMERAEPNPQAVAPLQSELYFALDR